MTRNHGSASHGAILTFWTDIPPAAEADFNAWYEGEHLPERLAVPGIQAGMRYVATAGRPRYLAFYEIDSPEAMHSPPYLARLDDPSPWTRRIMRTVVNAQRIVYLPQAEAGAGYGSALLSLRFAAPSADAGFAVAFSDTVHALAEVAGIRRIRLWQSLPALSDVSSEERRLRGDAASAPSWCLIVEASETAALSTLTGRQAAFDLGRRLRTAGAVGAIRRGRYRFISMLRAAD